MNQITKNVSVLAVVLTMSTAFFATGALAQGKSLRFVGNGKITINNTSSLSVALNKGQNITVNIDSATTKLLRRFGGKADISELQSGDTVRIIGTWTDASHTAVNARIVQDMSIQKKNGTFAGIVQSLTSGGFVLESKARGEQTVTISSGTILRSRKGTTITQDQIVVGNRVTLTGLWDRNAHTITEVSRIRDLSF